MPRNPSEQPSCHFCASHIDGRITWPHPRRIEFDLYRRGAENKQIIEYRANCARRAGGDVKHEAGVELRRFKDSQGVGRGNIADVEKVASRIEISDPDDGRLQTDLDASDLRGEAGDNELLRLARPSVVKQPEADRPETAPRKRAKSEVGSSFGHRVVATRGEESPLVEWPTRFSRIAVNEPGSGEY